MAVGFSRSPLVTAMTRDQLTEEQRAGPSEATFFGGGGGATASGSSTVPQAVDMDGAADSGPLWYSWPDHDLAAVLLTQVQPPSADVFDAFTDAVESGLTV